MPIFAWIFGLIAVLSITIIFYIFVPVLNNDIGDAFLNLSADTSASDEVIHVVDLMKISVPIALLVLLVGVLLYMVMATQKEEPHTDFI